MNLVIVESPAKAKTIEGFLGKDFTVKSSYGHIRDLAKKGVAIDVEKGFEPNYEVMPDKKAVIAELKKLSKGAEMVWLATDEDREGEAISWHLAEVLKLEDARTKRIVFHEITKTAIQKAIENPRTIDKNLVDAQQARRVLDRLVGFEISPVLWRKVKPSLSAGRVQSVAVRLIVERESEIKGFVPESSFRVVAQFQNSDGALAKAICTKNTSTLEEAKALLEEVKDQIFQVRSVIKKPLKRKPAAPFTTSTLQQEASRKLGYSVGQTMSVAQKLYEAGKITYMRTDSVNLSDTALNASKAEIHSAYGERYSETRKYATKNKSAQEAHEAIRPTYFEHHEVDGTPQEQKLYSLIWKRAIASQMAEAELEKTNVLIEAGNTSIEFKAEGEVITFDGFIKVYTEGDDDDDEKDDQAGLLPPMKEGENLSYDDIVAHQRFSHHPPRYTEASLVKKLEALGIGRPSTYAPTISTIQKRDYVIKDEREGEMRDVEQLILSSSGIEEKTIQERTGVERKKLFPTDIGIVVNDFLTEHFKQVMDYNFTAEVEKEFDEISNGNKPWNEMISVFYGPFHKNVEDTLENSERASGMTLLGVDPKSGKNVYSRIGRYGPMVQIGEVEDEEKPKFSSIKSKISISEINLEQALKLFDFPKTIGEFEGEEVVIGEGRFGPFVRHKSKFTSIGKELDHTTITLDEAIALVVVKREKDAKSVIKTFEENEDVRVLDGRYGPYIKFGKKNVKIPKDKAPESLTYEECVALSEIVQKSPRGRKKKA